MRRFVLIFAAVMNLVLADALTKELAAGYLNGSAAVSVIPNVFDLAYVANRGCAWGMFQGQVWPLAVFGGIALGLLIWKREKVFGQGVCARVTEILLYAGILGNMIDRVVRGYVIDFLDFHWYSHHFPCFNLADTFICVAAGLMILSSFGKRAS